MSYDVIPGTPEYIELQNKLPQSITHKALADGVRRINKRHIKVLFVQFDAQGKPKTNGDEAIVKNKRIKTPR